MVADRRQNAEPITNDKGMEFTFNSVEAKFVRLTVTSLDHLDSSVMEVEAYRGAVKVPFASAEASASIYDGLLTKAKDKQSLAKKLGDCFLGFSSDEWAHDIGYLQIFWAGNTNIYKSVLREIDPSLGERLNIRRYVPKKPQSAAQYLAFLQSEFPRLAAQNGGQFFLMDSFSQYLPYEAEWGTPVVTEEFAPSTYGVSFSLGWDLLRGAARVRTAEHGLSRGQH